MVNTRSKYFELDMEKPNEQVSLLREYFKEICLIVGIDPKNENNLRIMSIAESYTDCISKFLSNNFEIELSYRDIENEFNYMKVAIFFLKYIKKENDGDISQDIVKNYKLDLKIIDKACYSSIFREQFRWKKSPQLRIKQFQEDEENIERVKKIELLILTFLNVKGVKEDYDENNDYLFLLVSIINALISITQKIALLGDTGAFVFEFLMEKNESLFNCIFKYLDHDIRVDRDNIFSVIVYKLMLLYLEPLGAFHIVQFRNGKDDNYFRFCKEHYDAYSQSVDIASILSELDNGVDYSIQKMFEMYGVRYNRNDYRVAQLAFSTENADAKRNLVNFLLLMDNDIARDKVKACYLMEIIRLSCEKELNFSEYNLSEKFEALINSLRCVEEGVLSLEGKSFFLSCYRTLVNSVVEFKNGYIEIKVKDSFKEKEEAFREEVGKTANSIYETISKSDGTIKSVLLMYEGDLSNVYNSVLEQMKKEYPDWEINFDGLFEKWKTDLQLVLKKVLSDIERKRIEGMKIDGEYVEEIVCTRVGKLYIKLYGDIAFLKRSVSTEKYKMNQEIVLYCLYAINKIFAESYSMALLIKMLKIHLEERIGMTVEYKNLSLFLKKVLERTVDPNIIDFRRLKRNVKKKNGKEDYLLVESFYKYIKTIKRKDGLDNYRNSFQLTEHDVDLIEAEIMKIMNSGKHSGTCNFVLKKKQYASRIIVNDDCVTITFLDQEPFRNRE